VWLARAFAYEALELISIYRSFGQFFGNGNA
jgi:hypothetical protein